MPLEAEPSATLAYSLSLAPVWRWERWGFLTGDLVSREAERPLAFIEPYRPGRIPVVFVHGTASSPGRWADMLNVLMNDRRLRDRFQYWFFFYDTGNAMPYSALRLRQSLTEAVSRSIRRGATPRCARWSSIGHSQGGLLARLTVIPPVNVWERPQHAADRRARRDRRNPRPAAADVRFRAAAVRAPGGVPRHAAPRQLRRGADRWPA